MCMLIMKTINIIWWDFLDDILTTMRRPAHGDIVNEEIGVIMRIQQMYTLMVKIDLMALSNFMRQFLILTFNSYVNHW